MNVDHFSSMHRMDMDSFWSKQLVLLMIISAGLTRMLTIVLHDIHNTIQHLQFIYLSNWVIW
jgi:hypothetical protein